MVESTALEMRRGRKPTVGSNPTLSATTLLTSYAPNHAMLTCAARGAFALAVRRDFA